MPATAFLKASRLRAGLKRHPWVYPNSIEKIEGDYENGDAVHVRAPNGKFLGHALINDASRLALRLVSFAKDDPVDEPAFWAARVEDAIRLREDVLRLGTRGDTYRLVHSEGDGLPGLIVDRYADVLVYTVSSLGMFRRLDTVLDVLVKAYKPRAIVEQGVSAGLRKAEGLEEGRGVVRGELPESVQCSMDEVHYEVPLGEGQKTGLFLDQRENMQLVGALAEGRRVLDACCYLGGFSIACAHGGAESIVAFDQSADAIEAAKRHAIANNVGDSIEFVHGELFAQLNRLIKEEAQFDLIVLDPPKFAASKKNMAKAERGYLDSNRLALKLLAPGGILFTCSCSHHMSEEQLEIVIRQAADRSKAELRLLGKFGPGLDHPIDVHCPEGRYLKGFLFQRRGVRPEQAATTP